MNSEIVQLLLFYQVGRKLMYLISSGDLLIFFLLSMERFQHFHWWQCHIQMSLNAIHAKPRWDLHAQPISENDLVKLFTTAAFFETKEFDDDAKIIPNEITVLRFSARRCFP